jgi:hypothetical protein
MVTHWQFYQGRYYVTQISKFSRDVHVFGSNGNGTVWVGRPQRYARNRT